MFESKLRPIVIPQSEHLKLVGTLALLWGNADFDLPPIERLSMVAGMVFTIAATVSWIIPLLGP